MHPKQNKDYSLLLIGIVFLIAALCSCKSKNNQPVILEKYTDERGLISVIFTKGKDTFGLDYLTYQEYDSLFDTPGPVQYFKDGQILLPSYACPDTLIVMDAETLNANFAYVEQDISWGSDADIDSLLHCENKQGLPACMDFYQYVEFQIGNGYRPDIALHIANVDFGRIKADDLYTAIMED